MDFFLNNLQQLCLKRLCFQGKAYKNIYFCVKPQSAKKNLLTKHSKMQNIRKLKNNNFITRCVFHKIVRIIHNRQKKLCEFANPLTHPPIKYCVFYVFPYSSSSQLLRQLFSFDPRGIQQPNYQVQTRGPPFPRIQRGQGGTMGQDRGPVESGAQQDKSVLRLQGSVHQKQTD